MSDISFETQKNGSPEKDDVNVYRFMSNIVGKND
jgi:hypothetical protein